MDRARDQAGMKRCTTHRMFQRDDFGIQLFKNGLGLAGRAGLHAGHVFLVQVHAARGLPFVLEGIVAARRVAWMFARLLDGAHVGAHDAGSSETCGKREKNFSSSSSNTKGSNLIQFIAVYRKKHDDILTCSNQLKNSNI